MLRRTRLESMRNRIIDFEKEIEERIEALLVLEADILNTAMLRGRWLASVSHSVGGDSASLRKKLEVLRTKSELIALQLASEDSKIEGFHETQALKYLIEATKPYDDNEVEETRRKKLDSTIQNNIDDLKDALNQSILARSSLTNDVHNLVHEVEKLKFEHEQQNASIVGELQRRISQYTEQLHETSALSKANDRVVTGDYLVLRHNSRVAKELLVRSQNQANYARGFLQEEMEQVAIAAANQREKVEQSSEAELQDLTDGIRIKLLHREQELEDLQTSKRIRKKSHKKAISLLEKSCDEFNRKHDDLQAQRKNDLEKVGGELKRLREMVGNVESRLLKISAADDDASGERWLDKGTDKMPYKNGRSIIENLEDRLKSLRRG